MPIGFDPLDTVLIRLDCFDGHKPESERARFKFRFLTSKQAKKVERLRADAAKAKTHAERDELLDAAILEGLADWENVNWGDGAAVPFSPEALGEFKVALKFAIVSEYPMSLLLTDMESFRSSSPSPAGTASSAKDAPAVNAPTNQA